jgi:predicted small lipoprotein YifL
VWPALAGLVAIAACGDADPLPEPDPDEVAPVPAAVSGEAEAEALLSLERLQSATYFLPQYGGDPVRLRLGEFADEATERYAALVEAPVLRADLDGDGEVEAAVIVAVRRGVQLEANLVAMDAVGGRATQRAVIELGAGVVVTGMRREGEQLVLDVLRVPSGPAGRPRTETRSFVLDRAGWIEIGEGRE